MNDELDLVCKLYDAYQQRYPDNKVLVIPVSTYQRLMEIPEFRAIAPEATPKVQG